jgi:2Fe-2S ferredoxin
MPKINFIEAGGKQITVDVPVGRSVMQGAVDNRVPGILGECGGSCACGTCRIYIDDAWIEKTGAVSEFEEAMLEAYEDTHPNKRLSCQIEVAVKLDGLIVRLPKTQT